MDKKNLFSRVLGFIGLPGDLQTLWVALGLSTAFGTVTGIIEYWIGSGQIAWAILIGFGVFSFALLGLNQIVNLYRSSTVFKHIMVRRHEPVDGEIQTQLRTMYVTVSTVFENTSERAIYYRIERASLSLQGRINQNAKIQSKVSIIQSKSHKYLRHPTITDLKVSEKAEGKVELEVLYGPAEDNLRYKFTYIGRPSLVHRWDGKKDNETMPVTLLCAELKADHKKLSWI